jgi:probable rRNA maturation factor
VKPLSRRRASPSRKPASISLVIGDLRWKQDASLLRLIRRASRLALQEEAGPALSILLADDARLRALNAAFRGKAKPTNVLSFPSRPSDAPYLGDVALAYGVVEREARAQGKSFAAHAAHLVVHGILHLTGQNHEKAKDARAMEALETGILAKLGIADPYAPRPCTGPGKAA